MCRYKRITVRMECLSNVRYFLACVTRALLHSTFAPYASSAKFLRFTTKGRHRQALVPQQNFALCTLGNRVLSRPKVCLHSNDQTFDFKKKKVTKLGGCQRQQKQTKSFSRCHPSEKLNAEREMFEDADIPTTFVFATSTFEA